ncbi:hypothetical protein L208DRAFT_1394846 [Tricholoma matsutake]|nr:hypothetical protein L208DRAFT_1394846 [Tricholoma matsutake 945]
MASSLQNTSLDNTVGVIFIGATVSSFVFGVSTLQAYLYYHRFPEDSLLHKCAVAVLWILDIFHLAICIHVVYAYNVTGFGDLANLLTLCWSLRLQVAVNVVIVLLVQTLYAHRVWLLCGYLHGFLGYLVAAAVAGGFGIGIVLAYEVYTANTFLDLEQKAWAVNASLGTSTVIDFFISITMCYYLRQSKGLETHLNSRISRLMQYTLSSGLFTSACSLSAMFSYILLPNTFIVIALGFLLTKLYVGSFLAMLNSRQRTRRPSEEPLIGTPTRPFSKTQTVSFRNPSLPLHSESSLPSTSRPSTYYRDTTGDKFYP